MAKMWAGVTAGVTDSIADDFNSSIRFDCKMYKEDITGSMAHAAMLAGRGIISQADADTLIDGLQGILEDLNSGRRLYALYWEGMIEAASGMSDGFVVPGTDTAAFLEDKLARLGLTEREAEEFIVYWMPLLQENPYNLIRFEDSRAIDEAMPLLFSVEPDTLIRVWMVYQPLEAPVEVPEQVLPEAPVRRGFTAVEWGGRLSAAP